MGLTTAQWSALAIIPKVGGMSSFLGGILIIRDAALFLSNKVSSSSSSSSQHNREAKDEKKRIFYRLMIGMVLCDLPITSTVIMSSWTIPANTEGIPEDLGPMTKPVGTDATCTMQGVIMNFGAVGTPLYNASLALYYVLLISYNLTEAQMKRAERCMHVGAFSLALGLALTVLALDLVGPAGVWCWITSDHVVFRLVLNYGWVWGSIITATICMVILYRSVWKQEQQMKKYMTVAQKYAIATSWNGEEDDDESVNSNDSHWSLRSVGSAASRLSKRISHNSREHKRRKKKLSRSKQVRNQAFCFLVAFWMTWTPATVNRFLQGISVQPPYWISVLHCIFSPSQGFFNFLIYTQKRYLRERQIHPEWSKWQLLKASLNGGAAAPTRSPPSNPRTTITSWTNHTKTASVQSHAAAATTSSCYDLAPPEDSNDSTAVVPGVLTTSVAPGDNELGIEEGVGTQQQERNTSATLVDTSGTTEQSLNETGTGDRVPSATLVVDTSGTSEQALNETGTGDRVPQLVDELSAR